MIELEDVSFSYPETSVLEGVSLQVEPGELVGLIGPNGAGKTTVLRLIADYMDPDSGRVGLSGDEVRTLDSREASRRVAVVPQATRLSFDFPVREVVAMGRNPHLGRFDRQRSNDRKRVDMAMDATDTEALAERPFRELSGGERKRVLLARAIAQSTPNLLLDEPTASLDINHQIEVFDLVAGLRERDRAVLAAIHDLDLAARYCDRLALLFDGTFGAVGPPEAVLDPATLEAAYGIETRVLTNPTTDTPVVVPDPPRNRIEPAELEPRR